MKEAVLLALALPLLLSACDTSADNTSVPPPSAGEAAPATGGSPGPAHGYQEHTIFNDRYSSTTEIVYVSPVDGKTMICTVHRTGNGAGNSCRVKE